MSVRKDWVSQYGHLTIEQLKNINFKGQGQIQQSGPLWSNHLTERGHALLDDLEHTPHHQQTCPEITISKLHYNILQRYHKQ